MTYATEDDDDDLDEPAWRGNCVRIGGQRVQKNRFVDTHTRSSHA